MIFNWIFKMKNLVMKMVIFVSKICGIIIVKLISLYCNYCLPNTQLLIFQNKEWENPSSVFQSWRDPYV